MHLRLMNSNDSAAQHDPLACINADILRDSLAIDRKLANNCSFIRRS
jgi:staphylococcal nuclease domain-containing protein 1